MSADHVVRDFDDAAANLSADGTVPLEIGSQLRTGLCAVIAMSGAAQASHAADEKVRQAFQLIEDGIGLANARERKREHWRHN